MRAYAAAVSQSCRASEPISHSGIEPHTWTATLTATQSGMDLLTMAMSAYDRPESTPSASSANAQACAPWRGAITPVRTSLH